MSIPEYKKLETNEGEAAQSDPDYESFGANPKCKSVRKPLNILDLNSDCLQEIFNLKNVSVLELALIAQSCAKLRTIAADIFVRAHSSFEIGNLGDAVMVDRVLIAFGSSILDLYIDFTSHSLDGVTIIDSVLRNCSKLQSLTMDSYEIPDCPIVFAKIRRLFGTLKSLNIQFVIIEGCEEGHNYTVTPKGNVMELFEDCSSLVHFKIVECLVLNRVIFESKFPKLQHFDYSGCVKDLLGFSFRHQNLKTLILDAGVHFANVIESISANCMKLQELELNAGPLPENSERALKQLDRLQDLTKLTIARDKHSAVVEILKAFQQSTSLKVLELRHTSVSWNLIPTIAQTKSLRILKLRYIDLQNPNALRDVIQLNELFIDQATVYQFNFDLVYIIEGLVNLKKFKFHVKDDQRNSYLISRNVYVQLVNVVQHRSVAGNAYLEVDCPTTGDFQDLLCPTVEFKKLSLCKMN